MKIQFSVVGQTDHYDDVWIDLPAVPREGEVVHLPGLPQYETVVRTVVWYPVVDDEGEPTSPFVYVVLGSERPR